jgi:hypothetical protein
MLGVTEVSVNRALQRARHAVERAVPPGRRDLAPLPGSAAEREVVARFTAASWPRSRPAARSSGSGSCRSGRTASPPSAATSGTLSSRSPAPTG